MRLKVKYTAFVSTPYFINPWSNSENILCTFPSISMSRRAVWSWSHCKVKVIREGQMYWLFFCSISYNPALILKIFHFNDERACRTSLQNHIHRLEWGGVGEGQKVTYRISLHLIVTLFIDQFCAGGILLKLLVHYKHLNQFFGKQR